MADTLLHPVRVSTDDYDPYRYNRTPMQPRFSTGFLMQKAFENTREDLLGMNAGKFLFSDPIASDSSMSPLLSPSDAKEKYNVDTGDDWLTEAQVAERSYQNMRRSEREAVLARASGFWQKAAIVGTSFATTFTDPAEVALMAIPFVGSTSYARLLARLAPAAKAAQLGVEAERVSLGIGRPLAVLEQMAGGRAKWGARAIAGTTEGTLGVTSYMPINYWVMSQQGRDFDTATAFQQILGGAVLGLAFRTGFGKLGDVTMSANTRKALVREAAIALSKDQVPNFETIHALDEVNIFQKAIDDDSIRTQFPDFYSSPTKTVDAIREAVRLIGRDGLQQRAETLLSEMPDDLKKISVAPWTHEAMAMETAARLTVEGTWEKRGNLFESDILRKSAGTPERKGQYRAAVKQKMGEIENQIISQLQAKDLQRDLLNFVESPQLDRIRNEAVAQERLDPTNPDDMAKMADSAEKFSNDVMDDYRGRLDEADLEAVRAIDDELATLPDKEKAIDVAIGCVTSHA